MIAAAAKAEVETAGARSPAQACIDAADRIGRRLCRDAVWSGSACNWLGWSTEQVGSTYVPAITALPGSLYHGVAGLALFLARLVAFTRDRRQLATLKGAVATLLCDAGAPDDIGYFTGSTGIAHVLVTLGESLGDEALVSRGIAMLEKLRQHAGDPARIDLMTGYAGTIPALIDVAQRHGRDSLIEIAVRQAEKLVEWRHEDAAGASWPSVHGARNLTGYSHGAAGIGLALLEVYRQAGGHRFLDAGVAAFRYERSLFDRAAENWPDFRTLQPGAEGPKFAIAWCNGATGIGISRLRASELLPGDPILLEEADAAMRTAMKVLTAPQMPGAIDMTYCHGLAGHADYLLQISERLQRNEFRDLADRLGAFAIMMFDEPGLPWPCGVPNGGGETPALMLGTAGIGHFFLRLASTASVPSALIVRPAIRNAGPCRLGLSMGGAG